VVEGGVVVDKAAHNAEQAALLDEMVGGCTVQSHPEPKSLTLSKP
jgi:hypothetical protein